MARMERLQVFFSCPTYNEISMSPGNSSFQGRSSPAGRMQMGDHMNFGSERTFTFDAVGGMLTA